MHYFDLTSQFIEDSQRAMNLEQLATIFHKLVTKMGCTHFVCMSHVDAFNPPDDAVVLASYPIEWGQYHSQSGYHKVDPVQQTCRRQLTPFTWSNDQWRYMLTGTQERILNEASEFGLKEGHTIPIHPPSGYPASLSVVFEKDAVDPQALQALHLIAIYLYTAAIQLRTSKTKVYLQNHVITKRQVQILEFMAMGKSNGVIADILAISENTVKHHVKAIYNHFNVCTRPQAVVAALHKGIINYGDVMVRRHDTANDPSGLILIQP